MKSKVAGVSRFSMVPDWLSDSVSAQAVALWIALWRKSDWGSSEGLEISRPELAKSLGYDKTATVDRYIKELEEAGALTVEQSRVPGSKLMTPNTYTLHFDGKGSPRKGTTPAVEVVPKKGLGVVPERGERWSPKRDGKDSRVLTELKTDSVTSPSVTDMADAYASAPDMLDLGLALSSSEKLTAEFESWYAVYPKQAARALALRAFKAARKKTSLEELTEKAQAYRDQKRNPDFYMRPDKWLIGECWTDEDLNKPKPASLWDKAGRF